MEYHNPVLLHKSIDDSDEVVVCVDGDDDAVRFELDVYSKKFYDSYKIILTEMKKHLKHYCFVIKIGFIDISIQN